MGDLKPYRQKRDASHTPEPFGDESPHRALAPDAARLFVVQQHAARAMHWDLRLEIDGVLVSWAIPKGPSLRPQDKRLAVQTEDHPLEYADFEGVIPSGNYGAGAMIVWDRGAYRIVDGQTPAAGLEQGKLDLVFAGQKLRGRFALVRTRSETGRDWLLIRKQDGAPSEGDIVVDEPGSVLSGLRVEELRESVSHDDEVRAVLEAAGAPKKKLDAAKLRPMLASTGEAAFSKAGWLFELKYDGVRVIAARRGDDVEIHARTGAKRTHVYPEVARALAKLPLDDFILDGEIVTLDERGRSSFQHIQQRFTQTDPDAITRAEVEIPVFLYAFDLISALGHDLRSLPLVARKQVLSLFVPRLGFVRFADHVEGDGEALFAAAASHELEGVIAKQADCKYETGKRSKRWLKLKVPRSASLAIVGYLQGKGSRRDLGSLMLAWRTPDGFQYAGNAGSGLDDASIRTLLNRLEPLQRKQPAFAGAPKSTQRMVFVEPKLCCEVRFTEVTESGALRHPVFVGVQEDRSAEACDALPASKPEPANPGPTPNPGKQRPKLELTRTDKVFWPVEGYTKGDLLAYYDAVWPFIGRYLRDRPLVLRRYPDGIEGKNFYQQNAPAFTPDWVRHEQIDGTDFFICNDKRTLLYVINSGAIPLHIWSSRLKKIDHPDWLILDLDPKEAPFSQVVELARHVHGLLDELRAKHFVKSSGQAGIHILLPLGGKLDHSQAKALAEVLARVVCAERGDIATVARPLAARGKKVYVDYLQNGRGKLIAAPFSVRPRPTAPVSMPLTWNQVTARLDPARWNIKTALRRVEKHGDPLRGVLAAGVNVKRLLSDLEERLSGVESPGPRRPR